MAIYVYRISDGSLASEIPDNLTIAQAQAIKQLATNAQLAAAGYAAVDSLPPLGPTVAWNPATKATITVTPPTPPNVIATWDFVMAFTPAEWAAIRASADTTIAQFLFAMQCSPSINLNHTSISNALNYLVSKSLLTAARATAILATVNSGAT